MELEMASNVVRIEVLIAGPISRHHLRIRKRTTPPSLRRSPVSHHVGSSLMDSIPQRLPRKFVSDGFEVMTCRRWQVIL